MEELAKEKSTAPAGARNPNHLFSGVDSISSLPDDMLHHIMSFVPTNVAIQLASCPNVGGIKTLDSYTAEKILRFHLYVDSKSQRSHHVDSLIKFALSHNVEKLSLVAKGRFLLTQLIVDSRNRMSPKCPVSWTSLQSLSLRNFSLDESFTKMLSVAEFHGVHFPTFKVKTLTLKSTTLRSTVRGIEKLLQNSPELKKIKFYKTECWSYSVEKCVNRCLEPLYLTSSSKLKIARPGVVASFIERFLQNTRTLETLILQFGSCLNASNYDKLSQIALTLSHKYKVSIVLK
ncbi:unnamed protein product [Eruca vesicaria subsp. sativa]|uniref:Uncharacterized protein n=1 Tax=Eruca vesicaria subsp. sativa TaxID=29727 RepID=A0ABC8J966_ERUVS|nr:unnamed protein product [Eruca vesicaria subsp. sativa]